MTDSPPRIVLATPSPTNAPPRLTLPAPSGSAFTTPVLRGPRGLPGIQGPPGGGTLITGEVPAGVANGSTINFTLAHPFVADSTSVYRNGILEQRGIGYTESSPQVIFSTAPLGGDVIVINYVVADSG